jgi:hypothetical protein
MRASIYNRYEFLTGGMWFAVAVARSTQTLGYAQCCASQPQEQDFPPVIDQDHQAWQQAVRSLFANHLSWLKRSMDSATRAWKRR